MNLKNKVISPYDVIIEYHIAAKRYEFVRGLLYVLNMEDLISSTALKEIWEYINANSNERN